MDLGAFSQINDLNRVMKDNNIQVPRLRGLRLMSKEHPITQEEIERTVKNIAMLDCEYACCADFVMNYGGTEYSDRTLRTRKKYLVYNKDGQPVDVRWDRIHGKKRKVFKYEIKMARRYVEANLKTFNKYVGRNDILYIHARIGGGNWNHYRHEVENQPWFIEKVDDSFDQTYCDIYAKIKSD